MTDLMERLAADVGGRYVVERELGRGGMATVYLARDLVDERQVAIKVMDPELSAAVGAERFKREIDVASRLQHPNILGIIASGEAAGTSYYVMPFVKGETLRDRLERERQLPIEDALSIARQVAGALDYAHQQGVVHRDIKPENILLEGNHALVADFGIARAASSADTKTLTKTGIALGTPHYMSPEQVFGEKTLDGRTDQYALACMLHEMLAGMPPFVGPHAQSLMAQHAIDEPPFVTKYRPTTPANVEDAILTGLAKKPADRFATLADFSEALENSGYTSLMKITRLRATQVAPAPAPEPRWTRVLPIAAGLVLAVAGGAGAWTYLKDRPATTLSSPAEIARASRIAVLYLSSADSSLVPVADGLTEALIDRLRDVSALSVRSRDAVLPFRESSLGIDSIGRALDVGSIVTGAVREDGERLRVDLRLLDAESNTPIAEWSVSQPRTSLLAVQDSVAQGVEAKLRSLLGDRVALKEKRSTATSVEAWTLLQRAERARTLADSARRAGKVDEAGTRARSADSIALRAASLDAKWSAPHVTRAGIAYWRAEAYFGTEPKVAMAWLDSVVSHASAALERDPRDADALDLRGAARFGKTRLGLIPEESERNALLDAAQEDLAAATRIDPTQATAFNTLSRLQYGRLRVADALSYATKAYEADAYLRAAPAILNRLFLTSYDLNQPSDALKWCEEGGRRFPADRQFVECRLLLLLSEVEDPAPQRSWALVDQLVERTPPQAREYARRWAQIMVARDIWRAGLVDSAQRVLDRARPTPEIDPRGELLGYEGVVRARMGDTDRAVDLMSRYLAANPEHRDGFKRANAWWYAPISNDRRFRQLLAGK